MKDILEEIVAWKRVEVARAKEALPERRIHAEVERLMATDGASRGRSMRDSLAGSPHGIIAEFKRRSPSRGEINGAAAPGETAAGYERAGASALSVLTDGKFFGGSGDDLAEARRRAALPALRKDFIIDEYQVFEARLMGADAILLIAADLERDHCRRLAALARELGMETLLEIHGEAELDHAGLDVDMVGVNNRDLGTFHTDVANSFRLAERLPAGKLRVSESGISDPGTIMALRRAGFRGFLIGERLMGTADPGAALTELIVELGNG